MLTRRLPSGMAVIAVALIAFAGGRFWQVTHEPPAPTVTSVGPTVEKLEALEELVIQKVTVSDILSYSDGPVSASWLIRGDGLISVPLSGAKITSQDAERKTATILLPLPKVLSARVDHERTRFWDSKQGFWNKVNPWGKSLDELQTHAMREAQRLVAHAVESPEHLEQARKVASRLIQKLYSELGWTITIEWTPEPADRKPSPGPPLPDEAFQPLPSATLSGRFWVLSEVSAAPPSSG